MILNCAYNNHREACNAVYTIVKQMGHTFVERPWNMYEPDTTAWWLVPSSQWPAYKYGKYYFGTREEQVNKIICGPYFEKGLGSELSKEYTSASGKRCIMQNDWAWFHFIDKLTTGQFKDTIDKISDEIGSTVELGIETSFVTPSEPFDPYESGIPSDVYLFGYLAGENSLTKLSANNKVHSSDILNNVDSIYDIHAAIEKLNNNPWLWIDVLITVPFNTSRQLKRDSSEEWTAYNIWDRFLSKFMTWL